MALRKALAVALLLCALKLSYRETSALAAKKHSSETTLDEQVPGESQDGAVQGESQAQQLLGESEDMPVLGEKEARPDLKGSQDGPVLGERQERRETELFGMCEKQAQAQPSRKRSEVVVGLRRAQPSVGGTRFRPGPSNDTEAPYWIECQDIMLVKSESVIKYCTCTEK